MAKLSHLMGLMLMSCFLTGCIGGEKITLQNSFDPSMYSAGLAPGPNTISGQSALIIEKKLGPDMICKCGISQGAAVYLMPVIPVTTELMIRLFGNDLIAYAPVTTPPSTNGVDKQIFYKAHRGDCDKFGSFTFDNLADGSYYLWMETRGREEFSSSVSYYGGTFMKKITVRGGQKVSVNLMRELGLKLPDFKKSPGHSSYVRDK